MKQKRRSTTCKTKIDYDSLDDANKAIYVMTVMEKEKLSAYKCLYCKKYHVGHQSNRDKYLEKIRTQKKKRDPIELLNGEFI